MPPKEFCCRRRRLPTTMTWNDVVHPRGNAAMLGLAVNRGVRHCDGVTRREMLRLGAVGLGGLTLPALLRLEQGAAASPLPSRRAKSVIMLFLSGGPSHLDMWDLKPEA